MQTKPKPSPTRPAKAGGQDPWGPWIELVLGLGRALWGGGERQYPPPVAGSEAAPGSAGPLVLVHSSATVVMPARKPRRKTLRLVARLRADA